MRHIFTISLVISISVLAANRAVAQEVVEFEATKPHAADQVLLKAELYKPDGADKRSPAVVLMHGCGGWQPAVRHGLQTHARYLRQRGFVVLNVDSFGPRQSTGGKVCASLQALYQARTYRTYDAFDALQYLRDQDFVDPDNIFLVGQSNGGSVAIRAAKATTPQKYNEDGTPFRGIVAYYPWCGEFGSSRVSLASPLLVLAGGKDDWVPARECQGIRANGAELQVKIYPEAAHSFDLDILTQRYQGKLVGGHPEAATDSRERMLTFFVDHLTGDLKQEYMAGLNQEAVTQNTTP